MAIAAIGALAGILLLVQASSSSVSVAHAGANCGGYQQPDCPKPPPKPECPDPSLDCGGNQGHHGGGANPTGGAGEGGELPFTGYPVTPLILLLLLLLASGVTLRTYLAARDRLRERHAGQLPLA